ncbi:hypothetical protein ACJMK2_009644 [Sinanodonta woodiana]|uniref:G-protein coupled receptors family 1 profile domain-containing protein n=1 Tax=Sinanodonta woodiana TaxID=1069815 RepID=A0ABD3VE38_SINWO
MLSNQTLEATPYLPIIPTIETSFLNQTVSAFIDNMANMNTTDTLLELLNNTLAENGTNVTTTMTTKVQDLSHIKVKNLIYNHLGPTICMFGMICNVINLLVLTQHQLPESPYTYLIALACTDFTALLLSFVYMIFSQNSFAYIWKFYDCYIFLGCVNICTTSSVWITVQLTIERFLFVRHPLWAKATCNRASTKVKILITVCIASVVNIPRFMVLKPKYSDGKYILDSTELRKSLFFFGMNWIYSITVHFLPLIILSLANFYLVYAVRQAGLQREKLQIRNNREAVWQREQRKLTITLISIVFLFIICIIPSAFSDRPIAYALFGSGQTELQFITSSFYLSLQYVANFLVWCELSLNFVLYCAFNEKFRRVMKWMVKRWLKRCLPCSFNFHSITRNSTMQTASLTLNTNNKGQQGCQQELQPLHEIMNKKDQKRENENGDVYITSH